MRPIFVVFGFPSFKLSSKIPFVFEMPSLIELLRIGFMAPLDLSVHLRATWRYVPVRDAEIGKMPSELWSERRTVIGLNVLNGEGKMLLDLSQEVDGGLGVVVIVDAQNAKSGSFVNSRELIKALTRSSDTGNELHIELYRAARELQRRIRWFGAGTILLQ
jgi:hypothetical protein